MQTYIKLLAKVLILFSLFACSSDKSILEENENKIYLQNKTLSKVPLSLFTSGMEVVKLETTEESLLGTLNQIRISKRTIFLKDNILNGIYEFDKNGKFIRTLNKGGGGPGEYYAISDFLVDEQSQTLEVLDSQSKRILIYNLQDFSFINEIKISLTTFFCFAKKESVYYFSTKGHANNIKENLVYSDFIALDTKTNNYTPFYCKDYIIESNQSWDFNNPFTVNSQNEVFVSSCWQNKCFKLEGNSITSILSVDAGDQDIPDEIKRSSYDDKVNYLTSSSSNNTFLFYKMYMYEGEDFIVSCTKGFSPSLVYYYIRYQGEDYLANTLINDYIAQAPEIDGDFFLMDKNSFIMLIAPDSDSPLLKPCIETFDLKPDDNPTILIFNFKGRDEDDLKTNNSRLLKTDDSSML